MKAVLSFLLLPLVPPALSSEVGESVKIKLGIENEIPLKFLYAARRARVSTKNLTSFLFPHSSDVKVI